MPHPCSGKGDRVRRIVIGVECVWVRGQWLIPYVIMVIFRRERGGGGYGLALNGHGATSGQVMMRVI